MSDDMDVFDELEEKGSRVAAVDDDREEFKDRIREELAAIDDGDKQKTVSIWDGDMAAVIRALEDDGELTDLGEKVGAELQKSLGREPNIDDLDRSELLRMAFRLGMQDGAPGVIDDLVAVKKESVEQL
ncbi:hypothetical protein [Natronorubrum thiooxidans]|nr:hypothetical protein [Natronorubrum thiooxidans]